MDFKAFIADTEEGLSHGLNSYALAKLLASLDDPVFYEEWLEYVKSTNNYVERDECRAGLLRVMRFCGERSARRSNQLTNVRYGIGIGTSIVAASLVGIATAATGGLFAVPLVVGALIAGGCMSETGPISQEEKLYKDIEARIAKILEKS
jgi:hypothetical protein